MQRMKMSRRLPRFVPRVGRASRAEIEYFCRRCRGHFSATVPVAVLQDASCRCGSRDLLVYGVSGDMNAPLLPAAPGPAMLARQRRRTA